MDTANLKAEKAVLRKVMKPLRKQAFDEIKSPEEMLWPALVQVLADLPTGSCIAGYAPIQTEFPTWQLMQWIQKSGHRLALPLVVADAQPLEFLRWQSGADLVDGAFGAKTPDPATAERLVPDALLVPLLAFDQRAYRLGYGGGFYDRSIAKYQPKLTVGIAYAKQVVEQVPIGEYDLPLTHVITEEGLVSAA